MQNGSQIESLYDQYRESTSLLAPWISFYQQCYDATWTLGLALKRTLNRNIFIVHVLFLLHAIATKNPTKCAL